VLNFWLGAERQREKAVQFPDSAAARLRETRWLGSALWGCQGPANPQKPPAADSGHPWSLSSQRSGLVGLEGSITKLAGFVKRRLSQGLWDCRDRRRLGPINMPIGILIYRLRSRPPRAETLLLQKQGRCERPAAWSPDASPSRRIEKMPTGIFIGGVDGLPLQLACRFGRPA
jgi:hypothetical protein